MFSTIKSIIKTLSILSLFATLVVAGLSNVNASALEKCADGSLRASCAGVQALRTPSNGTTGASDTLISPVCPTTGCPGYKDAGKGGGQIASRDNVAKIILNFASFFIYIASAIAVVFIVYGGYRYLNAADPKGAESGKSILINALIGLAICILAITIVSFISGTLTSDIGGNLTGTSTIGQ